MTETSTEMRCRIATQSLAGEERGGSSKYLLQSNSLLFYFGVKMTMRGDASISTSGRCYLRLIERLLATLIVSFITPGSVGLSAAEKNQYLAGQLLVASPEMRDPRFVETVIYMVSHDASGALGVIINRPIAKGTFGDLLKAFDAESDGAEGEVIIHYGGPVSPNLGFILHSDDYLLKESTVVRDGIAMTAAAEVVRAMSLGKGPSQALIVLGYAGWAPGQLEGEIQNNHWFTIPADKTLIFSGQPEKKWEQAIERRRITL